jgi:hypothetical protein
VVVIGVDNATIDVVLLLLLHSTLSLLLFKQAMFFHHLFPLQAVTAAVALAAIVAVIFIIMCFLFFLPGHMRG